MRQTITPAWIKAFTEATKDLEDVPPAGKGKVRDASQDEIMEIYRTFDDLFRRGDFGLADHMLAHSGDSGPIINLLAVLSITTTAKEKLPSRAGFALRVRERIVRDDPSRAEDLLRGLE